MSNEQYKGCDTCAHRAGSISGGFAKCGRSGLYIKTQRMHPSHDCDERFSGWTKRAGVFDRFMQWLLGGMK